MSDEPQPLGPFERRLLGELLVIHEECLHQARASAVRVRSRAPRRLLRSTLLALVAATTIGGGAFAAKGVWDPILGGDDRGSPIAASSTLPASQRRRFGVLARPQTGHDRGQETERALRLLPSAIVDSIHTADVRVLFRDPRREVAAILVPVGKYDVDWARLRHRGSGTNGLCLLFATARGAVTYRCHSSREATRIHMPATTAGWAYGLVPNGVAAVHISYARGREVRIGVHNNFYLSPIPRGVGLMTSISWVMRDGSTAPLRR